MNKQGGYQGYGECSFHVAEKNSPKVLLFANRDYGYRYLACLRCENALFDMIAS
jgi:hypothetical protein